jgi:hypothetical protein
MYNVQKFIYLTQIYEKAKLKINKPFSLVELRQPALRMPFDVFIASAPRR